MTSDALTAEALLAVFRRHRATVGEHGAAEAGIIVDLDGPVRRRYPVIPSTSWCMIEAPRGLGERGAQVDRWIQRQVEFFTDRGEPVEWKTYSFDTPADLGERLVAAGFTKDDDESLILGDLTVLAQEVAVPRGVTIRRAHDDHDLRRLGALTTEVFGDPMRNASVTDELIRTLRERPESMDVVIAEESTTGSDGPVLSGARVDHAMPTLAGADPLGPGGAADEARIAGMWGGATLPQWRGRGLYRAILAERARLALARGARIARVDASPDSRPILIRLGLHHVATTTPYLLRPTVQ